MKAFIQSGVHDSLITTGNEGTCLQDSSSEATDSDIGWMVMNGDVIGKYF